MGFYIRKSFKIGALRLNLSKSGLGASLGAKGARLGLSAKGKLYTHLGRWGFYHRQDLGSMELPPATSRKGIGFWILIALGILFALLIALAVATAADRLDVFAQEGRRTGYASIAQEAGRPDLFDRHSNRLGNGVQRPDLSVPGEADRRPRGLARGEGPQRRVCTQLLSPVPGSRMP